MSRKSAHDLVKIENRSHKRSHKLESEESERFYFFISRFVVFRGIKSDDVLQRNANKTSIFQHGGSKSTEVCTWHACAYVTQISRASMSDIADYDTVAHA